VADTETGNKGAEGYALFPENLGKFNAKITHFGAKFSYVLDASGK